MSQKDKKNEEPPIILTKPEKLQKSDATRIKELMRKRKKFMSQYYDVAPFKEPVLFFERRSGDVEFYENVTSGLFEYDHSDGEKRFQIINPKSQRKFGFGNRAFRGYYSHEDYPISGLPDPLLTAEQVNIIVEKSLNDMKKWKAQELKAKGDLWWKILAGVAVIILAAAAYAMFVKKAPTEAGPIVLQGARNLSNATIAVLGG